MDQEVRKMSRRDMFRAAQGSTEAFGKALSMTVSAALEFGVVGLVALLVFAVILPVAVLALLFRLPFMIARKRKERRDEAGSEGRPPAGP